MRTIKSYVFSKQEIHIPIPVPHLSFKTGRWDRGNMWEFLQWLACFLALMAATVLVGMILVFWGHALYKNATTPSKPLTQADIQLRAKEEFAHNCYLQDGVPNVGSDNAKDWSCQK